MNIKQNKTQAKQISANTFTLQFLRALKCFNSKIVQNIQCKIKHAEIKT